MWRKLWLVWLVAILGVTVLPLKNYVGHAHWNMVTWIPYNEHPLALEDVIGNIALFVPFGFFLKRSLKTLSLKRVWILTLLMAATISTSVEFFQVYCHNRNPSTTDICDNLLGAALGVWLALSH
jgi:glycopeptide antibiotics resistance protein